MKKARTLKSLLAVVLSFSLVFTMAVPSFAGGSTTDFYVPSPTKSYSTNETQTDEAFNYLALGDSMTNGYGTAGYSLVKNEGFNQVAKDIYPEKVASYLNKKLKKPINLYQYAFTALRAEDVLAFLSEDGSSENYFAGDKYTDIFIKWDRVRDFDSNASLKRYVSNASEANYSNLKQDYIGAVKKADLITLSLGVNTFTCMFFERITSWTLTSEQLEAGNRENPIRYYGLLGRSCGPDAYYFESVLSGKQLEIFNSAKSGIYALINKVAGAETGDTIEMIADDMLYSLISFMTGYDKLANRIYELNPDADVAFIGFPNGVRNMKAIVNVKGIEIPIDLEAIVDIVFNAANTYIMYQSMKYKGDSFYVDYKDCDQIYADLIACGETDIPAVNTNCSAFKNYYENFFLNGITDEPFKSVGQAMVNALNGNANGFDEEKILKGVSYLNGDSEDSTYETVGKVYLGMRAQFIKELSEYQKYLKMDVQSIVSCLSGTYDVTSITNLLKNSLVEDYSARVQTALNSDKGLTSMIYFYEKVVMDNGYGAHTSISGHEQEAEKIEAAYEKFLAKQKIEKTIMKAIPLLVGGVTVALISSAAVKNMKSKSDASLSAETVELSYSDSVESDYGLSARVKAFVEKMKSFVSGIFGKAKANTTYELNYAKM